MEHLPFYISIVFGFTTLLTVLLFYVASNKSGTVMAVCAIWLALQVVISRSFFYTDTQSMPPRFIFLVGPPLLMILFLFITSKGQQFLDRFNPEVLNLLHIVRIPVELVLYWLCLEKMVPQLMTFEGQNFDILSGISAPIIYYLAYIKKSIGKNELLIWNIVCLLLLLNIVFTAVFSAPFPFQKFAFDQPNIAVLYFPYVWLPCTIVPLVLLSHLISIRRYFTQTSL